MSAIYQKIMQQCYDKYNDLKSTESCNQDFECRTDCLSDIYWTNKTRTYGCQTITYMYVLRFMNKYASEIYYLFSKYISNLNNGDLIFSIGSGPCFETVGIERFCREKDLFNIKYIGTDKNNIWQDAANICCHNSITECFLSIPAKVLSDEYCEKILSKTRVLIFNYVLSDCKNHNSLTDFLNNCLGKYLDLMPYDSYVIVNDINHSDEWEEEFDEWKSSLPPNFSCTDYFFNQSKPCNPRGGKISIHPLLFDNSNMPFVQQFVDGITECTSSGTIIYKDFPF